MTGIVFKTTHVKTIAYRGFALIKIDMEQQNAVEMELLMLLWKRNAMILTSIQKMGALKPAELRGRIFANPNPLSAKFIVEMGRRILSNNVTTTIQFWAMDVIIAFRTTDSLAL